MACGQLAPVVVVLKTSLSLSPSLIKVSVKDGCAVYFDVFVVSMYLPEQLPFWAKRTEVLLVERGSSNLKTLSLELGAAASSQAEN